MKKNVWMAVLLLLTVFTAATPSHAYKTRKVFIAVIDGLRNEEAFDDPEHALIPNIWNNLVPAGTIYTEFYNDARTVTTPAHMMIVTGRWHICPNLHNLSRVLNDVRPEAPTIFEYYRYHTGTPENKCLVVTGKNKNLHLDYSLDPAFGPNYCAKVLLGGSDEETYALLKATVEEDSPDLVLVNFRGVDNAGHSGDRQLYTEAIQVADRLVYSVWTELIQAEGSIYRDTTTLIVLSDHGRHLDGFGGFQHHGGLCRGCRNVPLLVIGPDTPQGRVVSERHSQTDIAPTVGELMGFRTPLARGRVLADAVKGYSPRGHVFCQAPRVAVYNGSAFVTWYANSPADTGNQHIYLMRKLPGEDSFGPPGIISNPSMARWAAFPSIAVNENGIHVAWLDGRSLDGVNDTWSIFYRRSPDWGASWEEEELVVTSTFESQDRNMLDIVGEPEISVNKAGKILITVPRYGERLKGRMLSFYSSSDQGRTWREAGRERANFFPRQLSAIALPGGQETALVWTDMSEAAEDMNSHDWEVFFGRTVNGGETWSHVARLTYDMAYSYTPVLAFTGNMLLATWANRSVAGTPWNLRCRVSRNLGRTWEDEIILPTGRISAWQPTLVWNSEKGRFNLVWTEGERGYAGLRMSTSANDLQWSRPTGFRNGLRNGHQRNPSLGYANGVSYLVWEEEDRATRDWHVEVLQID